jgi:glycosyltransferase involved in cell wall biosynthesis
MKLSIVIPVYNIGSTIDRALKSIQRQSFKDYEIILIDDGSTDDTCEYLLKAAREDARLYVHTIENRGPGHARNYGVKLARGDYILFVDSDDVLIDGALELLIQKMDETKADLLIFGFILTDAQLNERSRYSFQNEIFDLETDPKALSTTFSKLYRNNLLNQVWNKVYCRKLLVDRQIRFTDYRYGEDRLYVFDAMQVAKRIATIEDCCYLYVVGKGSSLINQYYEPKLTCCRLIDERVRYLANLWGANSPEDTAVFDYMYLKGMLSCMVQLFDKTCPLSRREKRRYMKNILQERQIRELGRIKLEYGLTTFILQYILKTGWIWLNMASGALIALISKRLPNLFFKLKHPAKINANEVNMDAYTPQG